STLLRSASCCTRSSSRSFSALLMWATAARTWSRRSRSSSATRAASRDARARAQLVRPDSSGVITEHPPERGSHGGGWLRPPALAGSWGRRPCTLGTCRRRAYACSPVAGGRSSLLVSCHQVGQAAGRLVHVDSVLGHPERVQEGLAGGVVGDVVVHCVLRS